MNNNDTIMIQQYINLYEKGGYDIEWKDVLYIENKILKMINDIYYIKNIKRFELEGSYGVRLYFKSNDITYEMMISKRDEDIGFSIYNADDENYINRDYTNLTIKNDNKCIYTIYKIIINLLE